MQGRHSCGDISGRGAGHPPLNRDGIPFTYFAIDANFQFVGEYVAARSWSPTLHESLYAIHRSSADSSGIRCSWWIDVQTSWQLCAETPLDCTVAV